MSYLRSAQNPKGGKNLASGLNVVCIVQQMVFASMQIAMVLQTSLEK